MSNKRIGVTSGLKGFYAVLYDNEGPILSGDGCTTKEEAMIDAYTWHIADNIPIDSHIRERLKEIGVLEQLEKYRLGAD